MKEVIIPIEFANAVDFYGVNDGNIEVLRRKFPALKVIARGNEIKLIGEANQITLLETKLYQLIDYFKEHSILTPTEVDFILSGRISTEKIQSHQISHMRLKPQSKRCIGVCTRWTYRESSHSKSA